MRLLGGQFVGGLPWPTAGVGEVLHLPALLSSSARCLILPEAQLSPLHHFLHPVLAAGQVLCMHFARTFTLGKLIKGNLIKNGFRRPQGGALTT